MNSLFNFRHLFNYLELDSAMINECVIKDPSLTLAFFCKTEQDFDNLCIG